MSDPRDDPAYIDAYDPKLARPAFGLANTGAICYLNSLLQMLVGCTAFVRAVAANPDYMRRTRTGAAMLDFVGASEHFEGHSARILAALTADLAERRPRAQFGAGQECASEALVLLLDMMEIPVQAHGDPVQAHGDPVQARGDRGRAESPITRLFMHRFRCELLCRTCRRAVSSTTDHMVLFSLFHVDALRTRPDTPEAFAEVLRTQVSATENYQCPHCAKPTAAFRVYRLIMVPDIIVCQFNLFEAYGGSRRPRYFPAGFALPAVSGGKLRFRLVGQVEHSGSMAGGHYWARGLRAGGRVWQLNDTGVTPAEFAVTPGTHLIAYNYDGE
jgi:ubiquitin C-terminal hydrolase